MVVTTERTKVRMTAAIAGMAMPGYGINSSFSHEEGDTPELHPALAAAWVNSGIAEPVEEKKKAAK